jgi:hypothetical protein
VGPQAATPQAMSGTCRKLVVRSTQNIYWALNDSCQNAFGMCGTGSRVAGEVLARSSLTWSTKCSCAASAAGSSVQLKHASHFGVCSIYRSRYVSLWRDARKTQINRSVVLDQKGPCCRVSCKSNRTSGTANGKTIRITQQHARAGTCCWSCAGTAAAS